ncbi:MarR family winged helix-turn-helix transcriptional regulator [Jongsikchunia kroppenstedtii]|uniref:MarR family winged helix-turn-helix transcriptional regulator n=1 Tax=Jongsikchunia kroppenstedtii TaxID=1121721 RepID=UPI0009D93C5D|nr:MarR family transcriptional regulator [Jongsikchunia kroppenstedtii]
MTNVSRADVDVLLTATRDLVAFATATLDEASEVTLPQMRLMFAIDDRGSASCGALASALGLSGSSITRLADRLVGSGHVARDINPDNRSVVMLSLTDAGRDTVEAVVERRARVFRDALGRLDPALRAGLVEGLSELHDALAESADMPPLVGR